MKSQILVIFKLFVSGITCHLGLWPH
jgi:hypothetical protein